ncbi:MAG: PhoH family protein, partial [Amphiplicatus sp.]
RIDPRGNRLSVSGKAPARAKTLKVLEGLYRRLERGEAVGPGEVRAAAKLAGESAASFEPAGPSIRTPKRQIAPRTANQRLYLEALGKTDLVFGVGPAGTGKTYLAVAHAVSLLLSGAVERIVLSRPAVEAGERIGFLPGDMKEKVDPYLRPLYDALHDMMQADYVERRIAVGDIEIAPLAFMRGRTLARAAVILDEAQNATVAQMKMFLTRLGEGSHMAVTGDPSQTDLPRGEVSGLADALTLLSKVEGVAVTTFTSADVVRHPLVSRIDNAYDKRDATARGAEIR